MIAVKSMDLKDNFKELCKKVTSGETVLVSRPRNENVYLISEAEYNNLQKAKKNAEYLAKLDRSFKQLENGEVVIKTMEELEQMADE